MTELEGVKPPEFSAKLFKKSYNTGDIIDVVNRVIANDHDDVKEFAKQFPPTREGLRQLFEFTASYFNYREDPAQNQFVQTPSYFYHVSRVADCKTFTAFLAPIIHYMGLQAVVRYVGYGTNRVKHVYPIAILNGREIIMDVVYLKEHPTRGGFDIEKKFTKKIDYKVEGIQLKGNGLYRIGNTHTAQTAMSIEQHIQLLDRLMADIPDEVVASGPGDVTKMTAGQLERFIVSEQLDVLSNTTANLSQRRKLQTGAAIVRSGSLAGIGSLENDSFSREIETIIRRTEKATQPAFSPIGELQFEIADGETINGLFKNIKKGLKNVGKKIGDGIKTVGKKIVQAHKKIINAIFKIDAKKMAPYFLFLMIPPTAAHLIRGKVAKRRKNQEKSLKSISKFMGVNQDSLKKKMYSGVTERFNKTPEQLFSEAEQNAVSGTASVSGWGAIISAAIKAIGIIIKVVKQLVNLFKKKKNKSDMGSIGEDNMSHMGILEDEARQIGKDKLEKLRTKGGNDGSNSGGGGATGLALGAAALAAVFAFT